MRKNILKFLSIALSGSMLLSSVPAKANAKPLTTLEKVAIGAVGTGAVLIGGAFWFINKKAHENDIIPYNGEGYPVFDANKVFVDPRFKQRDLQIQDIVRCLIFWAKGAAVNGNKAFEAALNLYAMNTCNAEWYSSVVPVQSYSVDGATVDAESCLKFNWELYYKNPNSPYWLRTHPMDAVPFENICLVLGAKYHISLHKPGVSDEEIIGRQIGAFCAVAQVLLDIIDGKAVLNAESMAEYNIVENALVPVICKLNDEGDKLKDIMNGGVSPHVGDADAVMFRRFEERSSNIEDYQSSFNVEPSFSDKCFDDGDD